MTTKTQRGKIHLKCGAFHKRFPLTWTQKNILAYKDSPYVLVTGPPGTGKTVVLMCKGLEWLGEGKDVLVCSLHRDSIPTSWYLHTLLSEAKKAHENRTVNPEDKEEQEEGWGDVKYHECVLDDGQAVKAAVESVEGFKSTSRPLCLLCDYMAPETLEQCQLALELIKELQARLPETSEIWTSDWYSTIPEGFHVKHLQVPVRYTLEVFPLINVPVKALEMTGKLTRPYTYSSPLHATSGPDVIHLRHEGKGSDDKWPIHSDKCGRRVAKLLRKIGVGKSTGAERHEAKRDNDDDDDEEQEEEEQEEQDRGEHHYQFRDVMIVTRNEVKAGESTPFVRGLQAAGIPTWVFPGGDDVSDKEALSELILAPEDKVTVLSNRASIGLDRQLVVCLTGVAHNETWEVTDAERQEIEADEFQAGTVTMGDTTLRLTLTMSEAEKQMFLERLVEAHRTEMEVVHRLSLWSRCCRQLVVVHLPEEVQGDREFQFYRESRCVVM